MRRKGALLLIMCSFVLTIAFPVGAISQVDVMYHEPGIKPLIHGLGG